MNYCVIPRLGKVKKHLMDVVDLSINTFEEDHYYQ